MKNSQVNRKIFIKDPDSWKGDVLSYSSVDFYWELKISRQDIRSCNEELANGGNYTETLKKYKLDPVYTSALQRADFIFTIPYSEPTGRPLRILDLGSGFGNITMQIAKRFPDAEVYAADASLDILQFLAYRLKSENVDNVICVHISPLENLSLPFLRECFDIILLNGVLEWIGAGVGKGNPRDHQVKVLDNLRDLLSPEGVVYVGIESRFFISYFLGVKDPHSGLRFTSILPRPIANLISKIARNRPYRTYIYSHRGYKDLFRLSGFNKKEVRSSFIWASYKDPFSIIPTYPRRYLKSVLINYGERIFPTWRSRLLYKIFCSINLELFFAPSYLFYLPKDKFSQNHKTLAERYFEKVVGEKVNNILKLSGSTRDDGSLYFLVEGQKRKWNLKVPRIVSEYRIPNTNNGYRHVEYKGSQVYTYEYIDGVQINKNEIFNQEVFTLIKKFHDNTVGSEIPLRHGDFTNENIIRSKDGKLHLIDYDDIANEPQIYDLCDYFVQIARIEYKLSARESVEFLKSGTVLNCLKCYQGNISQPEWEDALRSYLNHKIKKINGRKQYGQYLNSLSVLLGS